MNAFCTSVIVLSVILLCGCDPVKGPVIVNLSGSPALVICRYSDGHVIEGQIDSGRRLWAGYASSKISSAQISSVGKVFELSEAELRTPLAEDELAAFILTSSELKKVTLQEARLAVAEPK